jgi:Uma2 family endonuclease
MSSPTTLVTAEQLFRIPNLGRCELINGEIIEMNAAGAEHGVIIIRIGARLDQYVERVGLGIVLGAETGFIVARDPDSVRAPDVAFISRDRCPPDGVPKEFWPGAPDLAVEVVSPTDKMADVRAKAEMWIAAGTKLVWIVIPKDRSVRIYRPGSPTTTLSETDSLDGEDVVAGFRCSVAEIFPQR